MNAIILAGGRGLRLGINKINIMFGKNRLIELLISKLNRIFNKIIIVHSSNNNHLSYVDNVYDIFPNTGPLGGIHAGLLSSNTQYNFILACDMPFICPEFIRYMIQEATTEAYDVIIPKVGNYIEPLHGIYSKYCIDIIEDEIKNINNNFIKNSKRLAISRLFNKVKVRYISEDIIKTFDSKLNMFFNINTPEELKIAQYLLADI